MYKDDRRTHADRRPIFAGTEAKTPEYEQWWKETFGALEVAPPVEHAGIENDEEIRRFMDLPKFLDLIASSRLLLPRIAELQKGDPYECAAKPDYSQTSREELERRIIDLSRNDSVEHA